MFKKIILCALLTSATVNAATLEKEFTNEDGDRICQYQKNNFHKAYVNVGFTGICKLSIPDEDLE